MEIGEEAETLTKRRRLFLLKVWKGSYGANTPAFGGYWEKMRLEAYGATGSDSQTGGKESTYSIAEGELLAPRASLSAIVFCALEIYLIVKLGKKVLLRQNS
ncbi:unnamed protein product, partial [Brassica oleracea var. botrytis]